ncbi:MAG: Ig-like domain-containing protein [Lachnospiraceae bacterium]|nr:Ig-like domain-containing protein [Lachnospiraceae bacterium]
MRKNVSKRLCALVMSFSLFGSVFFTEIPSEAKVVNSQLVSEDETEIEEKSLVQAGYSTISSDEAYDKIVAMKAKYPVGTTWTNGNTYAWECGWSAAGCMGFAHMMSDAAFGTKQTTGVVTGFRTILPSEVDNIYDIIRIGDVVRVPSNHSVVVLEKHSDYIVICEGNASGTVKWGTIISKDTILNQCTYIETRYDADAVTMSVDSREITVDKDDTYKLEAVITPVNSDAVIEWSSSNPEVAEVAEDGTVTGKSAGYAIITAKYKELGISASCTVECIEEEHIPITIYEGKDYSAVYDYDYYINKYADLKKAFGDDEKAALRHFVNSGMREGRQAIEDFNVQFYKNKYADLQNAFGNDLKLYYTHYINYGKREGRIAAGVVENPAQTTPSENPENPEEPTYTNVYDGVDYSAVYDYEYYMNKYADLKNAFEGDDEAAIKHFVNYGMKEGRQAKETFDVKSYKNRYKDLRNVYGSNLKMYYIHYVNYGQREGRKATGVVEIQDPVTVYDGIDYSVVYDYKYYINKYADLKNAFEGDDEAAIKHFVNYGMREGRQAKETFNVSYYKDKYADLQNAYGSDLKGYYMHYIRYGQNEGREAVTK